MKFQSTHPHGVRLSLTYENLSLSKRFNPRTHTGCDIPSPSAATRRSCFNPRTHTGCDGHTQQYWLYYQVSIHAPTRGATLPDIIVITRGVVSIHAPTRGATIIGPQFGSGFDVSIHAPTRGATVPYAGYLWLFYGFNPRTHTGCDAVAPARNSSCRP